MTVVERLLDQRYETPPFPASEFEKALAPFRELENYLELEARVAQYVDCAERVAYLHGLKDGIELMWELWRRDL
ncbi:hypothetical protein [Alicyclobacillus sendaiensis]|uniref:hypothetical protein n=1 Tax=Alicyclobacillus sendaiensis TaxID=192387 RepID=UPI0026F47B9E|nr:hypothetical protein [Alicyclobacillus sendaiensis]